MLNEELVKEIKQGVNVKNNLEVLYLKNKGFIYTIVKRYMAYADIDDLMQEGFIGLYNAIDPYEEVQGGLFISYAAYHIKQAVNRYIENCGKTVRIPVYLTSLIHNYKKVMNYYSISKNRKPSDRELCAMLDTNLKTLENIRATLVNVERMTSLDLNIGDTEGQSIGDMIASDENLEDEVLDKVEQENLVKLWDIVKDNTTDTENEVIYSRFKGDLSLDRVGEQIGVSRERVRQLECNALRKLRHPSRRREIEHIYDLSEMMAYSGGVGRFKTTWTSSTERAAIFRYEANV